MYRSPSSPPNFTSPNLHNSINRRTPTALAGEELQLIELDRLVLQLRGLSATEETLVQAKLAVCHLREEGAAVLLVDDGLAHGQRALLVARGDAHPEIGIGSRARPRRGHGRPRRRRIKVDKPSQKSGDGDGLVQGVLQGLVVGL